MSSSLDGTLLLNAGRPTTSLDVVNTSNRPSRSAPTSTSTRSTPHSTFDRDQAYGKRLDIASGTAVRFGGERRHVSLIPFGGHESFSASTARSTERSAKAMPREIDRARYAALYGPTTGDRVRLADTELIVEVEADRTRLRRRGPSSAAVRPSATAWGQSATAMDVPDLGHHQRLDCRSLGHRPRPTSASKTV